MNDVGRVMFVILCKKKNPLFVYRSHLEKKEYQFPRSPDYSMFLIPTSSTKTSQQPLGTELVLKRLLYLSLMAIMMWFWNLKEMAKKVLQNTSSQSKNSGLMYLC